MLALVTWFVYYMFSMFGLHNIVNGDFDITKKEKINSLIEKLENRIKNKTVSKIKHPTYFINLDRDQERREYMEGQLEKYCEKYQRFRACDYKEFLNYSNKQGILNDIKFKIRYDVSDKELGCTLSHLMAIKKAYDNGDDMALIMEDDNYFGIYVLRDDYESLVSKAPKGWEILQFSPVSIMETKENGYIKRSSKNIFYSGGAYLINRKGIEKIVNHVFISDKEMDIKPISNFFPNKGVADYYIYDICETYAYLPGIFIGNDANFKSTIHESHKDIHMRFWLNTLNRYDL